MTLQDIHILYEFNYWAKARMLGALDALPEQELYKDLKTSFGGIYGTLVHICGAEDIWLSRFKGIPNPKFLKNADLLDYAAVKKNGMKSRRECAHMSLRSPSNNCWKNSPMLISRVKHSPTSDGKHFNILSITAPITVVRSHR